MSPRTQAQRPLVLSSGPWKGVYDTPDPFDAGPDRLRDALNCYIPDPENGSGVYARNGFALGNAGAAITTGLDDLYGQAVYAHTQLDGTIISFVICDGKLLKIAVPTESAMTITNVTPVGVSIQSGAPIPVFITSMVAVIGGVTESVIVVNDGVNRPWVGTNLTSTPITGTNIDYDGLGSAWVAFGPPVVWQGACFFVLRSVNGVDRGEDIAWSNAGDPTTGWQQASFDNNMTLTQHSTGPLFGLAATNSALFYFRAESIGVVYGDLASLASTNTQDAVSVNVGCTVPATIRQFGTSIFFCDLSGRPYRYVLGGTPEAIWRQMRTRTRVHGSADVTELVQYATSIIEPTLNLYLVVLWRDSSSAASNHVPTVIYAFKAETGTYVGRWTVGDSGSGGVGINVMGLLVTDVNTPLLVFLGEKTVGSGVLGFFWFFRVRGWDFPDPNQWLDSTAAGGTAHPNVQAVTDRLGEATDVVLALDRATALTGNGSACQVTVSTPLSATAIQATVTPDTSVDGTYRATVGCVGAFGRGPSVTVAPTTTDATLDQWSLQRVSVSGTPSNAGPEDV